MVVVIVATVVVEANLTLFGKSVIYAHLTVYVANANMSHGYLFSNLV